MRRAAFLDRDGTIIEDGGYLADASRVRFLPGALEALRGLREHGLLLVVVSNQAGIARGLITPAEHSAVDARVKKMLADEGVPLDAAYYCAHLPDEGCACRKPRPGMIEQAAREHSIDLPSSLMIGDKLSDVGAGLAAGCITALIGKGKDTSTTTSGMATPQPALRGDDWASLLPSIENALISSRSLPWRT